MSGTIEFRRQTTILKYVPPAVALTGAEIGQHAYDVVVLTFAGYLNENITPATSLFTVRNTTDSMDETISNVSVVNDTVLLTLASEGVYGKVYTVSYAKGGAQVVLTDANSAIIDDFSSYPVTNTVPQGEITAPAFLTTDGNTYGWYEAKADHITQANGRVRTWDDISGNNHHLTSWMYYNAAVGPVWDNVAEEMDFFSGDGACMIRTPEYDEIDVMTVYVVLRIDDSNEARDIFSEYEMTTFRVTQGGTETALTIYNGVWGNSIDNISLNEYGLLVARFTTGSTSMIQWNKRDRLVDNFGTNSSVQLNFGSTVQIPTMSMKEIIIRHAADSDANISNIQDYLMNKYNISDE